MSVQETQEPRFANYGKPWGQAAARCLSMEEDFFGFDEEQSLRLMPIPESFRCPISQDVMVDPVATVDGAIYERSYIEQWFRQRAQQDEPVTSPATGVELRSKLLLPLVALQKAIEAYLLHRPELRQLREAQQSHQEAARLLQEDLSAKGRAETRKREQEAAKFKLLKERCSKAHHENMNLKRAVRGLLGQLKEMRLNCSRLTQERTDLANEVKSLQPIFSFHKKRKAVQAITDAVLGQSLRLVQSRARLQRRAIVIPEGDDDMVDLECISPAKTAVQCTPLHCSPRLHDP